MLRFLSSMHVAFWSILGMILWFGIGSLLASKTGSYYDVFSAMNEQMITQWLVHEAGHAPVVLAWFAGLCLIAGVLMLNTVLCIWKRVLPLLSSARLSKSLLAIIHILIILVMAGHALTMVVGNKHPSTVMFPGQTKNIGDGYSLRMDALTFIDDPTLLGLSKQEKHTKMTGDVFHYKDNHVILTLLHDKKIVARGRAGILAPLDHGSLHIVLKKFVQNKKNNRLGALMIPSNNPLPKPFFAIYALMILSLGWFSGITWKKPIPVRA